MQVSIRLVGAAFFVATLSACIPAEDMQPEPVAAQPAAKPEARAESKPEPKPSAKPAAKPVAKAEAKPVARVGSKPPVKAGWRSRQVEDLNGLEAAARNHMVGRIVRVAGMDVKSSAAAYNDASVNAGVTQTTRGSQNVVISARYEGGELVFEQRSGPTSSGRATNALPQVFYSSAIPSDAGLPWKGVESAWRTRRGGTYRLLHLSDIKNNDDKDYMALGLWTWTDGGRAFAGIGASGNDPFDAAKLGALKQVSGYAGHAVGVYGTEDAGIQLFTADVRLTVNFGKRSVSGLLTNGKDKATGASIFTNLELNSISLDAFFKGSLTGENLAGNWGGQFYGNGSKAPGSIGGTFGAKKTDESESLMGVFGAYSK